MDQSIFLFIIIGFIAQLIDGSLGMAYGVSANSFLLSINQSPVIASASVHAAKIGTTLVSGLSHWKFGNIDKRMVLWLLVPGVVGGALGAYLLTIMDSEKIKPYIALYLLIMGIRILFKAFKPTLEHGREPKSSLLVALGLIGGSLDAIGGGGWGPVVTSTLISTGHSPRKTIGSVNFSEFFVTVIASAIFIVMIPLTNWKIIAGLLIGGVIAAPLGAYFTKKIPTKPMMIVVGILIIVLQIITFVQIFFKS